MGRLGLGLGGWRWQGGWVGGGSEKGGGSRGQGGAGVRPDRIGDSTRLPAAVDFEL